MIVCLFVPGRTDKNVLKQYSTEKAAGQYINSTFNSVYSVIMLP